MCEDVRQTRVLTEERVKQVRAYPILVRDGPRGYKEEKDPKGEGGMSQR
jgi:hypothetical protein